MRSRDSSSLRRSLDGLPRMAWVEEASPLEPLESLATELGVGALWIKRDDKIEALGGGSKVRKLDLLLAQPLYQQRQRWHTTGATGSGHLVACARAARQMDHQLVAHSCPQPDSECVASNFAITQELATQVKLYSSRFSMAARRPYLMALDRWRGDAIIPPGGTCPAGSAGFVLAAFELCDQVRASGARMPDRIYIPIGSGGAAVGLALGLALAGATTSVHAISTVERYLLPAPRLIALRLSLLSWLKKQGVPVSRHVPVRLSVNNKHIGAGYAHPSPASVGAVARLAEHGIGLESVYSGKAMAALVADAEPRDALSGESVLFWLTCHGLASMCRPSLRT